MDRHLEIPGTRILTDEKGEAHFQNIWNENRNLWLNSKLKYWNLPQMAWEPPNCRRMGWSFHLWHDPPIHKHTVMLLIQPHPHHFLFQDVGVWPTPSPSLLIRVSSIGSGNWKHRYFMKILLLTDLLHLTGGEIFLNIRVLSWQGHWNGSVP